MRVGLFLSSGNRGGTELQFARLAYELQKRGVGVRVFLLRGGGPLEFELADWRVDFRVLDVNPRVSPVGSVTGIVNLAREMRRFRPDVLLAALPRSVLMASAMAWTLPPTLKRISAVRGFTPRRGRFLEGLYGSALRGSDLVICNSPHLVYEALDRFGVPQRKAILIPNGVNLPAEVDRSRRSTKTAVVVANFHTYKGHDDLIRAIQLIQHDIDFRLCGEGARGTDLRRQAELLGVADRLTFVSQGDISEELRVSDFAVHPSHTEGLSNAIMEELASGLPVVACDVGGNSILIEHGRNGLLVPPARPDALAAAIDLLVGDSELLRNMGLSARESMRRFSWDECADAYFAAMSELVKDR